jgi:hypothetical protein
VRIRAAAPGANASLWPRGRRGRAEEVPGMADLAYVLVVVGGFVLLALTLRGLERL